MVPKFNCRKKNIDRDNLCDEFITSSKRDLVVDPSFFWSFILYGNSSFLVIHQLFVQIPHHYSHWMIQILEHIFCSWWNHIKPLLKSLLISNSWVKRFPYFFSSGSWEFPFRLGGQKNGPQQSGTSKRNLIVDILWSFRIEDIVQ